jgi:hypothetical protein
MFDIKRLLQDVIDQQKKLAQVERALLDLQSLNGGSALAAATTIAKAGNGTVRHRMPTRTRRSSTALSEEIIKLLAVKQMTADQLASALGYRSTSAVYAPCNDLIGAGTVTKRGLFFARA